MHWGGEWINERTGVDKREAEPYTQGIRPYALCINDVIILSIG